MTLQQSVVWLTAHLARIRDGGVWFIPRSMTSFTIDHKTKTATKTLSVIPDPILDTVFVAAGWTVKNDK